MSVLTTQLITHSSQLTAQSSQRRSLASLSPQPRRPIRDGNAEACVVALERLAAREEQARAQRYLRRELEVPADVEVHRDITRTAEEIERRARMHVRRDRHAALQRKAVADR